MLGKFLLTYLLSFAFIFSGKVFVFMLGDQHALGNSPSYYVTLAAYYICGMLMVMLTLRFIFRQRQTKSSMELVLELGIYVVLIIFAYTSASLFISKYVAHLV
ncbi:hypothetical protein T458_12520 [Brevibacillus panacihumi W25]|uniref:Uncharacterized protein n=1 Tax=Brevibacillus panacihumi W25 TaxID=1408254 RepID=V6M9M2_9BACL|nr:hypothetical protein [Brevibacillus panacihumi]EST54560.1 hypothetical protein T458_12520 [Brevibacillus panacihumi W25]